MGIVRGGKKPDHPAGRQNMTGRRNIVLVGFMGTGKTTVGKLLAEELGLTFVDMDLLIEQRVGKPISRIFAEQGEPPFRAMERALVRELAARQELVIGTGGGVVLNPDNLYDFSQSGLVVCLSASPDVIFQRTAGEQHRPLIEHDDKFKRIAEILERRQTMYGAIPHQIDTSDLTPQQVAKAVLKLYEQQ
jgi:shikimate kinase